MHPHFAYISTINGDVNGVELSVPHQLQQAGLNLLLQLHIVLETWVVWYKMRKKNDEYGRNRFGGLV